MVRIRLLMLCERSRCFVVWSKNADDCVDAEGVLGVSAPKVPTAPVRGVSGETSTARAGEDELFPLPSEKVLPPLCRPKPGMLFPNGVEKGRVGWTPYFCHSIDASAESLCSARSPPTLCPMTAEHQYLSHSDRSAGSGANETVSCFELFSDLRNVRVIPSAAFGSVDGTRSSTSRRSKQPVRVRLLVSHRFKTTRQRQDRDV